MTNSYSAVSRTGDVTVGESQIVFKPGNQRPAGKYGAVLLHGSGATYSMFSEAVRWASSEIPAWLALAGIPCVSIQMGGNTYANDVAMTAIDNAITFLAAETGVPSTKVHVIGISMGGGTAVRYGIENPTKTAGIVGITPMANINRIYNDNTLGLRAAIGTAWGVTYPTALPADADLITNASVLDSNNIPMRLYYDDADAVILPADVTDLATAGGSTATAIEILATDDGHTEDSIKTVTDIGAGKLTDIINFLYANGA